MRRINWPRLIGGGLAAGVVITLSGLLLRRVVLEDALRTVMAELGRSLEPSGRHLALWLVYGLVLGIASLWVYAAIRPTCGAGVTTALYAAVVVWFFTYFTQAAGLVTGELFLAAHAEFLQVLMIGVTWGLAELCLATTLGAWLYSEACSHPMKETR